MKKLITLVIVALIGWIVYVSVLGTPEDKAVRNELLGSAKDFGQTVVKVFNHEKDKVEAGTYDEVLDKLDKAIDNLKKADEDQDYAQKLKDLEAERQRIKEMLAAGQNAKSARSAQDPNAATQEDIRKLAEEVVKVSEEMEKKK
ncbi:hypothetical protein PPO43_11840 [Saprospira sp. CCB-QB6]|uniref:hypothetical protein n=1 Tax=Saprospira sp. CCB-QB6 TaxID=3023936 RepID=UPI0023498422|nr:hypothetical protein [Saprospira sp. CCB-QB6]WCL80661.1 hypothetical protein PPO43_11840 [Saprospira sp. CCB-QB6]